MGNALGFSRNGLKAALTIKESYANGAPILVPGEDQKILIPEHLLNPDLNLQEFEDPLPLAVLASRDPESPMALAATTRMSPLGRKTRLIREVFGLVGHTSRHPLVKETVNLVTENDFNPKAIAHVRRHAQRFIIKTRGEYTAALRQNLSALMDGAITPRAFVREFFELTEAGNLRHDIRKRLILSLLVSPNIRPSIKFMLLENFHCLPNPVQCSIIAGVFRSEPNRYTDIIKEELRWGRGAEPRNGSAELIPHSDTTIRFRPPVFAA